MSPRVDNRGLRVSQRRSGAPKPERQATNLAQAVLQQEYLRSRTWLTVEQVRDYLNFPSNAAVREWATRNGIRKGRRGRTLVFHRTTLDKVVQPSVK